MTNEERDFLISLSKSIRSQLELQEILIDTLIHEDRYLSLQEVKEIIPGITTNRLNRRSRRSFQESQPTGSMRLPGRGR